MDVFVILALFLLFLLILCFAGIFLFTKSEPDLTRLESEKYYYDPKTNSRKQFTSLYNEASVDLSIIIPSYNEETRLPLMLDEALVYLEDRQKSTPSFTYEFIIVDDGSRDKTTKVALEYSKKYGTEKVRVLQLERNRGKGGAVRLGFFSGRGRRLLFADADGASKFSDLKKLERAMEKIAKNESDKGVVCGSRAHLQDDAIAQRSFFRTVLMHGFHFLVWFLCVRDIRDTQCGFKLFSRSAALLLFSNLHVQRWAFDVDLLYLAKHYNIPCAEVAIAWQEIDGSKMVPIFSWVQMGKDLILIRLRYLFGAWTIQPIGKVE